MYVLVKITPLGRSNSLCSKSIDKLAKHLSEKGYYWAEKSMRYIDDKNGNGGSGTDYIIELVHELN